MNIKHRATRYAIDLDALTVERMSKTSCDLLDSWQSLAPAQKATMASLLEVFGAKRARRKGASPPAQPAEAT